MDIHKPFCSVFHQYLFCRQIQCVVPYLFYSLLIYLAHNIAMQGRKKKQTDGATSAVLYMGIFIGPVERNVQSFSRLIELTLKFSGSGSNT